MSAPRTVAECDAATITDALNRMRYGVEWSMDHVRKYARGEVLYDLSLREVYSYGRHFPLVRYVPRELRRRERRDLYIVNGDTWGGRRSRTPEHQDVTRAYITARDDVDSLVIPFSALTGAGIDLDSIRPVHVRPDDNWIETREARTIKELPQHERTETYSVDQDADSLDGIPIFYRNIYRMLTADENAEREAGGLFVYEFPTSAPRLPDADGRYRWTENHKRERSPDPDGIYRWTVRIHRLGDALFSAVRAETERRRAYPFESERETTRVSVSLHDADGRTYCTARRKAPGYPANNPETAHEAGPSAACVYCGSELRATETRRHRARYLSSFDTNEMPALYFLAQVPRGAGETVESALDRLAPRAVHAALARGHHVARQGDIFFIDTNLTREDLSERGATFARLTQWTHDAAPKLGEVGYVRPLTAPKRRSAERRELHYTRKVWRDTWRDSVERMVYDSSFETSLAAERDEARIMWRDLLQRHERERVQANVAFRQIALAIPTAVDLKRYGDKLAQDIARGRAEMIVESLAACYTCGADIGEPCRCDLLDKRLRLDNLQRLERDELRRAAALKRTGYAASELTRYAAPASAADTKRRARMLRESTAGQMTDARAELRALIFRGPCRSDRWSVLEYVSELRQARDQFEYAQTIARRMTLTRGLGDRDSYRSRRFGTNALRAWSVALDTARLKYRPDTVPGEPAHAMRSERVRRALAIYGTAHSATETATVQGAVYVRGTVRHVVNLERDRDGAPDHQPLVLTDGRWYLAVRNTVPRQTRRRRRQARRLGASPREQV